jgi:MFS family permease
MAFGTGLVLFALSRSFLLSVALMVPIGFAMMIEMGSSNTLIQTMSPDHLRGRVMAVYSMMFMGMAPFGALLAGLAAERFGAPMTVAAGGTLCLAASGVFASCLPSLRAEAGRLIVAQQMSAGDPPQEMTGGTLVYDPKKER